MTANIATIELPVHKKGGSSSVCFDGRGDRAQLAEMLRLASLLLGLSLGGAGAGGGPTSAKATGEGGDRLH